MNPEVEKSKTDIRRIFLVYFGSAWVFIEAFNFIIDKYQLQSIYLDIIIIFVLFGLPATIIYEWFNRQFKGVALYVQLMNAALAITIVVFTVINPDKIDPTQLRLLKFNQNQRKLAQNIKSIAILPFANLTNDSSQIHLVNGMHEELIFKLGVLGGIRVVPRTSTLAYSNTQKSLTEISNDLNVDAIIEGSVLPANMNKVKIQLKLIGSMPEELQLWSKSYEVEKEKVLSIYSNVARAIVDEINLTLSPNEEKQLKKSRDVNPKAYELYVRGKVNLSFLTPQLVNSAEQDFINSLKLDPDFAPAYAGMAGIWVVRKQVPPYFDPEITDPKIEE